jgi:hypothetical protein
MDTVTYAYNVHEFVFGGLSKCDVVSQCVGVGDTPLSEAAHYGHKELAEMLVDRGANIEHADNDGMSPIVQTDFTSHDNRSM